MRRLVVGNKNLSVEIELPAFTALGAVYIVIKYNINIYEVAKGSCKLVAEKN